MRFLTLVPTMLLVSELTAQNLVPNGSFEQYSQCPDDISQIARAVGWSAIVGSADYFNACSDTLVTDVPANAAGYQYAFDGEAYMGCGTYASLELVREPVQAELVAPMEPGQLYYLSMRVSPGGFGYIGSYTVGLASNGIGLRFSTEALSWSLDLLDNSPVLYLTTILQDTSQWVTLAGSFVADSAYHFVQIGNFLTDDATQSVVIDPDAASEAAYAFVDDVCVSATPGICALVQAVPEGGGQEIGLTITYAGNAIAIDWSCANSVGPKQLFLFDGAGRLIWETSCFGASGRVEVDSSLLSHGIHCLRAFTGSGTSRALKFTVPSP